jgi:carboxypeptidase Taq
MGEKLEQLKQHLYPYYDLQHANAVLEWDQQVNMPPGGTDARAEQMATLTALSHDIFTSPETGRLLEAAETEVAGMDFGSDEASMVRLLRRQYDKQTKLPTELVAEISRVTAQAFTAGERHGRGMPTRSSSPTCKNRRAEPEGRRHPGL